MKAFAAAFFALILSIPWNAQATLNLDDSAHPSNSSQFVQPLGAKAIEVREEARGQGASPEQVYAGGRDLENGMVSQSTLSDFHPYEALIDWNPKEMEDQQNYTKNGDIASMMHAYGALLGVQAPPEPVLADAYEGAQTTKINFDNSGKLPGYVAGACFYTPGRGADEILVSRSMADAVRMIGDRFGGVIIGAHEGDHCYRAQRNELDPRHSKSAEVLAAWTEGLGLNKVVNDYEFSKLMADYGPMAGIYNANAPRNAFVQSLLAHFGFLRQAMQNGTMEQFIEQSGYADDDEATTSSPNASGPRKG